jgi:hypothetical protein
MEIQKQQLEELEKEDIHDGRATLHQILKEDGLE